MDEKVMKYRKNHRRCKYCIYKTLRTPKCTGLPDYYVCEAKDKIMFDWNVEHLPRLFCSCYQLSRL